MNWKQEQEALENAFARQLLIEYGIKETTTQRQAKNGTREFEFPVPARYGWYNGEYIASKQRLRLATFKTGYVRNQNSCSSNYQLNKQYKQNTRYTFLTKNGLEKLLKNLSKYKINIISSGGTFKEIKRFRMKFIE